MVLSIFGYNIKKFKIFLHPIPYGRFRDANINIQKIGRIEQKTRRFSKLHATSMAQNLPKIGRLPNYDVKIDKNVYIIGSLPIKQGGLKSL